MKPRPITQQELDAIKHSVLVANIIAVFARMGVARIRRRAAKDKRIPKWKVAQDELLAQLRWFEGRIPFMWSSPGVKGVIVDALDQNDHEFMMKLGRTLGRPAKHLNPATTKSEKLKQFLFDHWAESRDGIPPLVFFAPIDVAEVCSHRLGFDVDDSAVVKVRQRFHLKPSRHKLYRLVPSRDGFKFVRVDKT